MSTRGEIMSYILANPGVYMREISDDLALPMGVVQYHLWVLGRNGELEEFRSGRYRRFFGANRYPEAERKVLSLLRQGTAGRILVELSGQPLTHTALACLLGISSQALSWHMKRLKEMGIVMIEMSIRGERLYVLVDGLDREVQACTGPVRRARPGMPQQQIVR
jgi:predicted transcriptional regulator